MSMRQSSIYKEIVNGDLQTIIPVLKDIIGNDVNSILSMTDPINGDNLVHHIVRHSELYSTPPKVTIIYLFVYAPFDLDYQNIDGDTALHLVVRRKGAYRILIALMRCGADPEIKNNEGKTPEDILRHDKPDGWEEMLHSLNKFKPGLYRAVTSPNPDKRLIEKLLRSWCRLTMIKNNEVINLKCVVHARQHKQLDLVYLLEKYENTVEFAMAMLAGRICSVKSWEKQQFWSSVDINTKDCSYQVRYPDFPETQQPLLEAVWLTNVYETVNHLMRLGPNTTYLYKACTHREPTPLFFHIVNDRSPDHKVIRRVLKDCDLSVKDYNGSTILHEAIAFNKPVELISDILKFGINVATRNRIGQTARSLARSLCRYDCVTLIDEYVLQSVRDCNIMEVESLYLAAYDYIVNITDSQGLTAIDIAKINGSKQLIECIENILQTQEAIKKIHHMIDKGNKEYIKKNLCCKRYANAVDKCGRNVLHRAILSGKKDMVYHIAKEFPVTLNTKDNVGRTPLHYVYLCLKEDDVIQFLESHGADKTATDFAGVLPEDYVDQRHYNQRKKEVLEFDLEVFIEETNFGPTFLDAVKEGDLPTITKLANGLKEFNGINRYSKMLFDCLDYEQWEIANYLIRNGFNTDVYKQYVDCSPDDPLCAMMECDHGMTSFTQRVLQIQAEKFIKLEKNQEKKKCKSCKHKLCRPKESTRDSTTNLVSVSSLRAR